MTAMAASTRHRGRWRAQGEELGSDGSGGTKERRRGRAAPLEAWGTAAANSSRRNRRRRGQEVGTASRKRVKFQDLSRWVPFKFWVFWVFWSTIPIFGR
ncbi:hypothetical protein BRADI_1g23861v3 [Brachypodium distachyon]|uniref:Uncharacterized protein n=1 Tax=Brachypodium distachyon TaxID=15368 RepID=A0A2K2DKT1_BRADI|nr:hypothetical protein BRADI_1g23861v3 [Brachypodium distachyon]